MISVAGSVSDSLAPERNGHSQQDVPGGMDNGNDVPILEETVSITDSTIILK